MYSSGQPVTRQQSERSAQQQTTGYYPKNGFGVASLALGLLGFMFGFPASVAGMIFGFCNLPRLRTGEATNRATTYWGIALSAVSFLLAGLLLLVLIVGAAASGGGH